jgi:hypothetical protein
VLDGTPPPPPECARSVAERRFQRFVAHSILRVGRQFYGRATLEETAYRELLLQNDLFLKH